MEPFRNWFEQRHDYARSWKEKTGGKVLGYFCTYVPEEILLAADVLPVRILGSHEPQDVTEPHIFGMFCPFCRDCLAQGLKGRFDYLDGIAIAQSCLHIRQAYTSWNLHVPVDFSYYLPMPHHVQSPRALPFLREELVAFKAAVEGWTGKTITDADLDRGIALMNENRRLMREIYDLRKADDPPLTGLEAMYLVLSSQMVDKAEHNAAASSLLAELPARTTGRDTGKRLMILGSENDDTKFMAMAESLSATFVTDDHCTGTRYFWNQVEPAEDRLAAIAARYIERPACPTKDWPERRRIPHILQLAKEWRVDGAILVQQKFCDPHELDLVAAKKALEAAGIPTLFLEFDVTVPIGPFRIRVEAFLEMISQDDLF
ncbi:MAG TPA: benzoyl-CoA reductase, bzd-type, subunit N [Spirochaetia bacterium]|nr:benzoyl-CoA reductase, bzd-type, subunit N [Spirochaetia bacterium]